MIVLYNLILFKGLILDILDKYRKYPPTEIKNLAHHNHDFVVFEPVLIP